MTSQVVQKPRLHFVDGLRGLTALYVVVHHAWLQSWPVIVYGNLPHGIGRFTNWLLWGHFAVTVFIVLSGFSLMLSVQRSGLKGGAVGFYQRRVWRILPPYFLALILSLIVVEFIHPNTHTLFDGSLPVTHRGILYHFALIHNLSKATRAQINGPFWSIAVECQIYLFFPAMIAAWKRWGIIPVVAAITVAGYVGYWLLIGKDFDQITPHYYAMFAFGMLAAEVTFSENALLTRLRSAPWGAIGVVSFGILAVLCHRWFWERVYDRFWLLDLFAGIATISLLILCSLGKGGVLNQVLNTRLLVWVGTFSYSLYLIHFPVQQLLWQIALKPFHFSHAITFCIMATIGTAFLVVFSWLFFRICEKPFLVPLSAYRKQE